MKYIKKYNKLNKKTVDYNKIYTFVNNINGDDIYMIGKISPNPGSGFRDVGCIMVGYNKDGKEIASIIKYGTWNWVREAKPEEIEKYNLLHNINKYNL